MTHPPLVQEILRQATGNLPLQKALVAGAMMEGGSLEGPWPPGDGDWSRGPYQIKTWRPWRSDWNGHPISVEDAENPTTAVAYAIKYEYDAEHDVMAGLNYRESVLRHPNVID